MVTKKIKDQKGYYVCDECNFIYQDKNIAMKCEKWCKDNHSCNLEIIKESVEF